MRLVAAAYREFIAPVEHGDGVAEGADALTASACCIVAAYCDGLLRAPVEHGDGVAEDADGGKVDEAQRRRLRRPNRSNQAVNWSNQVTNGQIGKVNEAQRRRLRRPNRSNQAVNWSNQVTTGQIGTVDKAQRRHLRRQNRSNQAAT